MLSSLLGAGPSNWMMHPSERLTILGILSTMRPKRALELGCASGGLTYWLSQYCDEVVTVDIDPAVKSVAASFRNVTPMCMATHQAARELLAQGNQFDLTIIDADHSKQGVRRDLENVIPFSDVIVLHDTFYLPCREGILSVLAGRNIYFNLDLVPGGLQPDGLWGGLGIVAPRMERRKNIYLTPRLTLYSWLKALWRVRGFVQSAGCLALKARRKLGQVVRIASIGSVINI